LGTRMIGSRFIEAIGEIESASVKSSDIQTNIIEGVEVTCLATAIAVSYLSFPNILFVVIPIDCNSVSTDDEITSVPPIIVTFLFFKSINACLVIGVSDVLSVSNIGASYFFANGVAVRLSE